MSLLWSGANKKIEQLTNPTNPSPTYQIYPLNSARNPKPFLNGKKGRSSIEPYSIEGTSLFAFLSAKVMAGIAVEAAIVLPLFFLFFLNLGCAIELIRLHGNLQLALWQAGSRIAVYGYALDSGEMPDEKTSEGVESTKSWWKELAQTALTSAYVKSQLIELTGKNYLDNSPLTKGAEGLQLSHSEIINSAGEMEIVVTYSVSPWSSLLGFSSFQMANRYYAHIWNGYQLPNIEQTVYIAEHASVYHLDRNCTHLQLSIQTISAAKVDQVRNQYNKKYQACDKCAKGDKPEIFYITDEGDCYHYRRDCSGLKRTVYSVGLKEAAEKYRPCSRCGQ